MTAPDQCCINVKKLLSIRRRPHMTHTGHLGFRGWRDDLKEPHDLWQRSSSTAPTGSGVLASRADEYRRRARPCLEMARTFGDRDARIILSHMAQAWLRLADMTASEQRRPIVQQQQQLQPKDEDK
jgi:hypothetical protein